MGLSVTISNAGEGVPERDSDGALKPTTLSPPNSATHIVPSRSNARASGIEARPPGIVRVTAAWRGPAGCRAAAAREMRSPVVRLGTQRLRAAPKARPGGRNKPRDLKETSVDDG